MTATRDKLARWLWHARFALLTLALVLTALAATQLPALGVSNSMEIWYPQDDPALERYRQFQERFGNDLVGQDFVRAVRHPGCLRAIEDVLRGADKSRALIELESPVRATLEVAVASLGAGNEDDTRAMVSFADVSHVREAEQMRSDFVANVSHELRSPLTALSGFIETLQGAARDDAAARAKFLDLISVHRVGGNTAHV